jgi:hypothetical protein
LRPGAAIEGEEVDAGAGRDAVAGESEALRALGYVTVATPNCWLPSKPEKIVLPS